MKTTTIKSLMIATLISFSIVAFAIPSQTTIKGPEKEKAPRAELTKHKCGGHIHLSVQQAMKMPALINSLLQQRNSSFLNGEESLYSVEIDLFNRIFVITGSYKDWMMVFNDRISHLGSNEQKSKR